MPKPPRDRSPGIHHVWVNATGNWPYFLDPLDRSTWIGLLAQTIRRLGWDCLAFCQLTTHVHVVLGVPDESLPAGMQYLNREYSKAFNWQHGRAGIFVRKRYGNRRIEDDGDLLGAYAYVALNAPRAGLCDEPEEWPWSSFATTLGLSEAFQFVNAAPALELFDSSPDPRGALQSFVHGQLRLDPTGHVRYQIPDMAVRPGIR